MMLGYEELKRTIELGQNDPSKGILIVPSFDSLGTASKGSASIDLHLGRWFLSVQQTKTGVIDLGVPRSSDEFEAAEGKMNYVPFGTKFIVHPGRFVLGATLEWIRVPATLGGFITGKSTIGRRGLVIETAAGLHPGFSGCITLELANCGEVPIALMPGMPICQVFLHRLDGAASDEAETHLGGRRKPSFGPYKVDKLLRNSVEFQRMLGGNGLV